MNSSRHSPDPIEENENKRMLEEFPDIKMERLDEDSPIIDEKLEAFRDHEKKDKSDSDN